MTQYKTGSTVGFVDMASKNKEQWTLQSQLVSTVTIVSADVLITNINMN